MQVTEIAFSVYPVTDLKRARAFYEETLGLKPGMAFEGESTAWIEYEIGPSVVGIGAGSEHFKPSSNGRSVALGIGAFDQPIKELREAGTKIGIETLDFPWCRMASVLDPAGHT